MPESMEPTAAYQVLEESSERLLAVLPNRLVVVAQSLDSGPVVSVQYRVKTGSIYEGEHTGAGLSHYLEHLVAGGTTTTRSESQSNDLLADIGGQMNAFTGLEGVGYYINTISGHAERAIGLVTDWVMNNVVDETEVLRERDVIQREFEMGAGEPGRIQWKLTQEARFKHHPARHPIIGYLENFKAVTRDQLHGFYQSMYVPNNMVCVVVGDICPRKAVEQIAALWSDRRAQDLPEVVFPQEPRLTDAREVMGRADIPHPRVRIAWQGVTLGADDEPALDALAAVLGQGESSRLIRRVRDEQKRVVSIGAYNAAFEFADGLFGVDYQSPVPEGIQEAEHLAEVERAVLEVIQGLSQEPVTQLELDRVKRQIMAGVVQSDQSVEQVAGRLCRSVTNLGDPDYLHRYNQQIQALTVEDVMGVAPRYTANPPTMRVHLLPLEKEGDMPTAVLDAMPAKDPQEAALPQQHLDLDNRVIVQMFAKSTASNKIKARSGGHETVVEHRLANGLRVVVEPSRRLPAASMQLYRLGGLLADQPGAEGVQHAVSVMQMRGAGSRNASQLADAVESLGASLDTGVGQSTDYAAATALKDDFQVVMQLMRDVVLSPEFDPNEWTTMRARLLAAIDNQTSHWRGELGQMYRKAYFGDHVWSHSALGRRQTVEALTAEGLAAAHRQAIGFGNAVLAIVGDVDADEAIATADRLFGAGSVATQGEPLSPGGLVSPQTPASALVSQITQKPTTAVHVGFGPGVARGDEDFPAMAVLAKLASNFPSGYLDQTLRGEGPGLVYAVGAHLRTGAVAGAFEVVFNTDSENLQEAVSRVTGVIDRLKDGAIGEAELARAKAKLLTGEFLGKQTMGSRAADLALMRLYEAQAVSGQRLLDQVEALTVDQLQSIARRRFDRGVWAVLSPEPVQGLSVPGFALTAV